MVSIIELEIINNKCVICYENYCATLFYILSLQGDVNLCYFQIFIPF